MDPVPTTLTHPPRTAPVPKMLIDTPAAVRKGKLEVGTAEEIDELITALIIAKTGLLGAQSAIGAQGAMDAASEVEAERAESELETTGMRMRLAVCGRHMAMDASGRCDACEEVNPPEPAWKPEPGRGLASCGHPANEDGECDCSSWPERAPYDTREVPPQPVPLAEVVTRLAWLDRSQLRAALADISQRHPAVFEEVTAAFPPEPEPDPDGDGWPPPCPSCGQRDEHAVDCERAAKLAQLGAQVRQLSVPAPARPAGRHELASVTPLPLFGTGGGVLFPAGCDPYSAHVSVTS